MRVPRRFRRWAFLSWLALTGIPIRHMFGSRRSSRNRAAMVTKTTVISADSHVLEPEDLWEKALGNRHNGHIPRVVEGFGGMEGRFFYLGREGEVARVEEMVDANETDRRLADLAQAGK